MSEPGRGAGPPVRGSRFRLFALASVIAGFVLISGAAMALPLTHRNPAFVDLAFAPAATASVTVNVSNFAFTPNAIEVAPGEVVSVTVMQTTSTPHTFTLFNAANFSFNPAVNTTGQLTAFAAAHGTLLWLNVSGTPGATVTGTFTAPHLGVYQFACLQPGHFQAGMEGFLGSGVVPPGAATPNTGPGAPVFIIGGTIVALLVVAIVLGFVIGRRRGSVHEMPPERLGYPEPPESPPSPPTH